MIERQRRNRNDRLKADIGVARPEYRLLDVVDHVAVAQHRALGDARRPARVLQECNVRIAELHRVQRLALAELERAMEVDRAGEFVRGHLFLDTPQHEVDKPALGLLEQVANPGSHDELDRRRVPDLFEYVREVLEDDDRPGARVFQLMLELAGGV